MQWRAGMAGLILAVTVTVPVHAEDRGVGAPLGIMPDGFSMRASAPAPASFQPAAPTKGRRSAALPREVPEVQAEAAALPTAIFWRPARGAVFKVKPAKVRFNLDF